MEGALCEGVIPQIQFPHLVLLPWSSAPPWQGSTNEVPHHSIASSRPPDLFTLMTPDMRY